MHIDFLLKKIRRASFYLNPLKTRVRFLVSELGGRFCLLGLVKRLSFFYPHYFKSGGVIFIHVPKAAGTSVAMALYGRQITHLPASYFNKIDPNDFSERYSFAIVRNPYERIVSSYLFAVRGGTSKVKVRNHEIYSGDNFSSFDKFVKNWLSMKDVEKLDHIFRPQHLYVCVGDEVIVNDVFFLDDMEFFQDEVSKKIGRRIEIGSVNRVNKGVDLMSYHTDETKEIVYNKYKKDFDIFGFDK